MDVRYYIDFENKYMKDSDAAAKIAAVSIDSTLSSRRNDFVLPVVLDETTVPSTGFIRRTIRITLTDSFLSEFTTDEQQRNALYRVFKSVFQFNLPGKFDESVEII